MSLRCWSHLLEQHLTGSTFLHHAERDGYYSSHHAPRDAEPCRLPRLAFLTCPDSPEFNVAERSKEEGMVQVCTDWFLTPYRAALHLPTATAVVADLHLGYGATRQGGGDAVPCMGLQDTFADLKRLFE